MRQENGMLEAKAKWWEEEFNLLKNMYTVCTGAAPEFDDGKHPMEDQQEIKEDADLQENEEKVR